MASILPPNAPPQRDASHKDKGASSNQPLATMITPVSTPSTSTASLAPSTVSRSDSSYKHSKAKTTSERLMDAADQQTSPSPSGSRAGSARPMGLDADEGRSASPSTSANPTNTSASAVAAAATNDADAFFARAQALGLRLSKEEYERTRSSVVAFLKADRVAATTGTPGSATAVTPSSSGKTAVAQSSTESSGAASNAGSSQESPPAADAPSRSLSRGASTSATAGSRGSPMLSFFTAVVAHTMSPLAGKAAREGKGLKPRPSLNEIVSREEKLRRKEKRRKLREKRERMERELEERGVIEVLASKMGQTPSSVQSSQTSPADGDRMGDAAVWTPHGTSSSATNTPSMRSDAASSSVAPGSGKGGEVGLGLGLRVESDVFSNDSPPPSGQTATPRSTSSCNLSHLSRLAWVSPGGTLRLKKSTPQLAYYGKHREPQLWSSPAVGSSCETPEGADNSGVAFGSFDAGSLSHLDSFGLHQREHSSCSEGEMHKRQSSASSLPDTLNESMQRISFLDRVMEHQTSPRRRRKEAKQREQQERERELAHAEAAAVEVAAMAAEAEERAKGGLPERREREEGAEEGQDAEAALLSQKSVRWAPGVASPHAHARMTTREHYELVMEGIMPAGRFGGVMDHSVMEMPPPPPPHSGFDPHDPFAFHVARRHYQASSGGELRHAFGPSPVSLHKRPHPTFAPQDADSDSDQSEEESEDDGSASRQVRRSSMPPTGAVNVSPLASRAHVLGQIDTLAMGLGASEHAHEVGHERTLVRAQSFPAKRGLLFTAPSNSASPASEVGKVMHSTYVPHGSTPLGSPIRRDSSAASSLSPSKLGRPSVLQPRPGQENRPLNPARPQLGALGPGGFARSYSESTLELAGIVERNGLPSSRHGDGRLTPPESQDEAPNTKDGHASGPKRARQSSRDGRNHKQTGYGWAKGSPLGKYDTISPAAVFGYALPRERAEEEPSRAGGNEHSRASDQGSPQLRAGQDGEDDEDADAEGSSDIDFADAAASIMDEDSPAKSAVSMDSVDEHDERRAEQVDTVRSGSDGSLGLSGLEDSRGASLASQEKSKANTAANDSGTGKAAKVAKGGKGRRSGASGRDGSPAVGNGGRAQTQSANAQQPLAQPGAAAEPTGVPVTTPGQSSVLEWDQPDGSRLVKLVSEELQAALDSGTVDVEPPPRYYRLPAGFGQSRSKPAAVSYAGLIGQAILASSEKRLSLAEIYNWISTVYPFFERGDRGWQNSIRHNLSLNKSFMKLEREANIPGKGGWWAIKTGHETRFRDGLYIAAAQKLDAAKKKVGAGAVGAGAGAATAVPSASNVAVAPSKKPDVTPSAPDAGAAQRTQVDGRPKQVKKSKLRRKREESTVAQDSDSDDVRPLAERTNGQKLIKASKKAKLAKEKDKVPEASVEGRAPLGATQAVHSAPVSSQDAASSSLELDGTITPSRPGLLAYASSGHGSQGSRHLPMLTDSASSPPSSPLTLMPPPSLHAAASHSARKRKRMLAGDDGHSSRPVGARGNGFAYGMGYPASPYAQAHHAALQGSPLAPGTAAAWANQHRRRTSTLGGAFPFSPAGPGSSRYSPLRRQPGFGAMDMGGGCAGGGASNGSPTRPSIRSPVSSMRNSGPGMGMGMGLGPASGSRDRVSGGVSSSRALAKSPSSAARLSAAVHSPIRGSPLRPGGPMLGLSPARGLMSPAGLQMQMAMAATGGTTPGRGSATSGRWGLSPSPMRRLQGSSPAHGQNSGPGAGAWYDDPFDYQGTLQHELDFAAEMGGLGAGGLDPTTSPMRMMYAGMGWTGASHASSALPGGGPLEGFAGQ